ncbi:MAG TPA: hypothetical protein VES20_23735, partial [Bryobacteraceae bacterium]|nr:hypothetical protein [Bryobacteraceae bacterium]
MRLSIALLLVASCSAQDLGREMGLPLLLNVPSPPIAVRADGKARLVYELHIVNTSRKPVRLERVKILGPEQLVELNGEALTSSLKPTSLGETAREPVLKAGEHAVLFLWVTTADPPPASVAHHVLGVLGDDTQPLQATLPATPVLSGPVRLRPPVRGEGWVAVNGPANDTHHRRSWLVLEGQSRVPQRFAIDFIRVDREGQFSKGDAQRNSSFFCYGAEVVAVADATVTAVRDGIEESTPG